jgi:hypothetical protein
VKYSAEGRRREIDKDRERESELMGDAGKVFM